MGRGKAEGGDLFKELAEAEALGREGGPTLS